MNFSEQPPSKQWAALKYRGEKFAEVWFKPEGEPFALTFRIPQRSFQIPGMGQRLTTENLLKAVGIATEEVESWRHEGASHSGMNGSNSELGHPLPPPPQDVAHLNLYVSLKPPPQAVAPNESREPEIPEAKWQDLEARWKAILEPGSEHGYVTHKYGRPSGGNGSLVEEDVDGGRKSTCPERGRGSMEQGKKPRSLCPAEGERVYPSFHLGDGHTRKEEARGTFQEPHSTSDPFSSDG